MNTYGAVQVYLHVFIICAANGNDGLFDAPKKPSEPNGEGLNVAHSRLDAVEEDKDLSVPNPNTLFTVTKGLFRVPCH